MKSDRVSISPPAAVWLLGISQIAGYGTLYYSFSILAADIAAAFDWPTPWVYGSFSLGLVAAGVIAPLIGRRIDRHGAAAVMSLGSVVAAVALAIASLAPTPIVFTTALVLAETASALLLYDAAFAALVQTTGGNARVRINHLTLIAGFASTIFWPLTSYLHTVLDWREVLLAFAVVNLIVCLPIHLLLAANSREPGEADTRIRVPVHAPVPPEIERRMLWLVSAGFALSGLALSAVLAQMVPMLTALGLGSSALFVSTLFGPAQFLVRFANLLIGSRRHPLLATIIATALLVLSLIALLVSAPLVAGAVVFALLYGFGSGLRSIVMGTLPLALFGSGGYGTRLGIIALPRQILAALAPFALAGMIAYTGPRTALAILTAAALLGLACFVEIARVHRRLAGPVEELVTTVEARPEP
jgi:MFS family permease